MRAVFEREISDGTVSYRLWRSDGKPDIQYPRAENDMMIWLMASTYITAAISLAIS